MPIQEKKDKTRWMPGDDELMEKLNRENGQVDTLLDCPFCKSKVEWCDCYKACSRLHCNMCNVEFYFWGRNGEDPEKDVVINKFTQRAI